MHILDTLYRDDALLFARPAMPVYQNQQLGKWQTLVPGFSATEINQGTSVINRNTKQVEKTQENEIPQENAVTYPTSYHGFGFDEILRTY